MMCHDKHDELVVRASIFTKRNNYSYLVEAETHAAAAAATSIQWHTLRPRQRSPGIDRLPNVH